MDRHYTPMTLADAIVEGLPDFGPKVAADFAVGEGALIDAVRRRWPRCKLLATDIDRAALTRLKKRLPKVSAGICDFLNARSRSLSPVLKERNGTIPLIFLNPPFSSRGDKIAIDFEDKRLNCSRALAFTALSLRYLSADGRLIALLPASCLTSQKDTPAMAEINANYVVKVLPMSEPVRFTGCSVDVVVVQFKRRKVRQATTVDASPNVYPLVLGARLGFRATVERGRLPMPDVPDFRASSGWPLVHTTGLRKERLVFDQGRVSQKCRSITGPAILISRVGRPTDAKICLYVDAGPIVLTDCIIAIKTDSLSDTRALHDVLRAQARLLLQCYVGSCAKYLTVIRLTGFLESLGVSVVEPGDLAQRHSRSA